MNTTTTTNTHPINNNTSGNGNIGASAVYNAGVRPPQPPAPQSSSSSSSQHRPSQSNHHHHQQQHRKEQAPIATQSKLVDPINQKPSKFTGQLKFHNTLPEIPFEPKFLKIPTDFQRFTQYKTTSLERQYKHPLLTEPQLGIPIDLIDPSVYNTPRVPIRVPLEDEPLLKSLVQQDLEEKANTSTIFKKKSEIRPNVGWLRRTEYLSKSDENTFGRPVKRSSTTGTQEIPGKGLQGSSNNQLALVQEQLSDSVLVENTFDICSSDFQFIHPTNPSLKPTSVLPVFPDFELWANSFTEVTFDTDPLDHYLPKDLRSDKVQEYSNRHNLVRNKAIVKGITDKFVYFITPEVKEDKNNNNNNITYQLDENNYKMQKVLTSDIITDSNSTNYFFVVKEDAVYYNPLKNRVNLKKIKSKDDKALVRTKIGRPRSINYKTRDQTPNELKQKEDVMADLLQEERAPFSTKKLKSSD